MLEISHLVYNMLYNVYKLIYVILIVLVTSNAFADNLYNIPHDLIEKANNGDSESLYRVGFDYYWDAAFAEVDAYAHLVSDEEAFALAMRYLKKAADKNHIIACVELGGIYEGAIDLVKKDLKKSLYYYMKAAKAGNVRAMSSLAYIYYSEEEFDKALNICKEIVEKQIPNKPIDYIKNSFFLLCCIYTDNKSGHMDIVKAYACEKIIILLDPSARGVNAKNIYAKMTESDKESAEAIVKKWINTKQFD